MCSAQPDGPHPDVPKPAVIAALRFVAAINDGDLDQLTALMTDDHRLCVLTEPPLVGRDANRTAWSGYLNSFPVYRIHLQQVAARGGEVAALGSTTGSHLGLPDDEERLLTMIWLASVTDGRLTEWRLVDDTPAARASHGLREPSDVPPSLTLFVRLWAHDGQSRALEAYEDEVLALLPEHGARALHRLRARDERRADEPDEVHLLEFPNAAALDGYLADPRRAALGGRRDQAIARTEILRIGPD